MNKNLANSEHSAYSYPHMQQKLMERYGDRIIQTEINGKPNVITFRHLDVQMPRQKNLMKFWKCQNNMSIPLTYMKRVSFMNS